MAEIAITIQMAGTLLLLLAMLYMIAVMSR